VCKCIYVYLHFIKSLKCHIRYTNSRFFLNFTSIFIFDSWRHETQLLAQFWWRLKKVEEQWLDHEDGSNQLLRHIGNCLPIYTVSKSRTFDFSRWSMFMTSSKLNLLHMIQVSVMLQRFNKTSTKNRHFRYLNIKRQLIKQPKLQLSSRLRKT